jgi:excisionase family DNA binding protein
MEKIMEKLDEIQKLTLLGAKQALTMDDTSKLTGLSKSHLYKLCMEKKIPHYKSGGKCTYFDKDELNKFMLKRKVKTTDEVEAEAVAYVVTGKQKGGKK